jgi:ATP-dependent DNA helicase DinG
VSARALLCDSGPLARTLAGYEPRAGQLEMADAVEAALAEDRILLCEAGTGTGKTLAYLVPAILSGKKVVISTATRALQEQIAERDIPLIEKHLGLSVKARVMKGLGNYLCLRRFEEYRASPGAGGAESALALIERWRTVTRTGDVAEAVELSEDDPIWREVTSSSDTRVGQPCAFFDECFVTRMKREAEAARLLVVNHHLFFADLALRGPHPGHVIPDYDAVIFDEAHQLEDIATDFFGVRLSSARVEAVLRDLERSLSYLGASDPVVGDTRAIAAARRASDAFWARLAQSVDKMEGRVSIDPNHFSGEMAARWHELDAALEAVSALAESARGRLGAAYKRPPRASPSTLGEALAVAARRSSELRDQLAIAVEGAPGRVTWLEAGARGYVLSSALVDVSAVLRDLVFERVPAVVLTSATLASSVGSHGPSAERESPFSFVRSRIGLADDRLGVREALIASPFDFENNALLYLPRDLPEPGSPAFLAAAAERAIELIDITDGGAFVLTTSYRSMRALAATLRESMPDRRVLLQGEAPKTALLDEFRRGGDAVLVATQSFWEGVDIPGRALRLVILEKIPFAVPSDPLVKARSERIEAEGGNAFTQLAVPAAAIALKQGFGRLIRTRADHGIVALFDERVQRKSYGRRLLSALPPARRAERVEDVRKFWQERAQRS